MLMIDNRNVRSASGSTGESTSFSRPEGVEAFAPHVLLIVTQFIFSGWHLLGFLVIRSGANPLIFALYRETISSILMLIYVLMRIKGNYSMLKIDMSDYRRFLFVGFCCFVNVVGTVISLQYMSANRYAILQPAIPAIATVISCGVKLEKFTLMKAIGVSVAAVGAVITESHTVIESLIKYLLTLSSYVPSYQGVQEKDVKLGTAIVLLQCFAAANMIVFQKRLLTKYDPAVTTLVYYTVGTSFTMLVCAGYSSQFTAGDFSFYGDRLSWVAVAYASFFATLFAYNATSWANKRLPPSVTTVYNTLQPLGTVLLSYPILSSTPTTSEMLGGLVIGLGLMVTVYGRCEEEEEEVYYRDYTPIFTTAVLSRDVSPMLPIACMDIEYSELREFREKGEDKGEGDYKGGHRGDWEGEGRDPGSLTPTASPVGDKIV